MGFKEEILKYEPKTKTNISEFEIIRFEEITGHRQETFEYEDGKRTKWVITYKGFDVIVPEPVMAELKMLLKNMQLKSFKVIKEGQGKYQTKYKVIPIEGIPYDMGPYGRN